ncbi:MAG: hypothetical protein WC932_05370 [archaeon]
MDITKIKRRERRFYRTEENGEVEYKDAPVTSSPEKETTIPGPLSKETTITIKDKKQIIDKILTEMKDSINPDIDEITDVIYSQLSNTEVNVNQETIKQIVQDNAHYRSSRKERTNNGSELTNSRTRVSGDYDFLNDRKELELVIDDIVEETKKEEIRDKDRKDKTKTSESNNNSPKEIETKRSRHSARDSIITNSEKPKEETKKQATTSSDKKTKKEKKVEHLDFGDDEEKDPDFESEVIGDDELGLKF